MRLFLLAIFSGCLALSLAQASTNPRLKLTGYVTSFDQNTVMIESGNQRYVIPRTMYPDKTKSGELISIPLTQDQFAMLKHQPLAKR